MFHPLKHLCIRRGSIYFLAAASALIAAGCATKSQKIDEELPPLEQAVVDAEEAVAETPNDAEAAYVLGNALFDASRLRDAQMEYLRAIQLDPTMAKAYTNAGVTSRLLGDTPAAVRLYRQSLALEPDDEITLRDMVIALRTTGDAAAQIPYLEQLMQLAPDDLGVQQNLAEAYMGAGEYAKALRLLERLKRANPGDVTYSLLSGWCHYGAEDWDKAVEIWKSVTMQDENVGEAHAGLAGAYYHLGRYEESWNSVYSCQRLGVPLTPDFITKLQDASGSLGAE